jgi:addiction module RelE/StbE family toxin
MTLRLRITRLGKLDLDELIAYIGKENPKAAVEVASRILGRIDLLGEQPEIGRPGRRPGTRELVVDTTRYIVVYRVDATRGEIQILRILHTSRMWPERL